MIKLKNKMRGLFNSVKEFILDTLFPKFCINCRKEGDYLCYDCFCLIDILDRQYCPFCKPPRPVADGKTCFFCSRKYKLDGLYFATSYDNFIIKKLINNFKYEPYIKDLSSVLADIIIFYLSEINKKNFKDFVIMAVPVHTKKLKYRGYNQAKELAEKLSQRVQVPFLENILIKIKNTPSQTELKREQRIENLKNVFSVIDKNQVLGKKILLVDDVATTCSTLEECAKVLKKSGAKEVWGLVIARG